MLDRRSVPHSRRRHCCLMGGGSSMRGLSAHLPRAPPGRSPGGAALPGGSPQGGAAGVGAETADVLMFDRRSVQHGGRRDCCLVGGISSMHGFSVHFPRAPPWWRRPARGSPTGGGKERRRVRRCIHVDRRSAQQGMVAALAALCGWGSRKSWWQPRLLHAAGAPSRRCSLGRCIKLWLPAKLSAVLAVPCGWGSQ